MSAKLGTILPTSESMKATEAFALDQARMKRATEKRYLEGLEQRDEQGEHRFYESPNRYAIASGRKADKVLWFVRHADGYFYAE